MNDVFDGKRPEDILGKRKGETNKAAFRRKAKQYHPDAGSEPDPKMFDQVTQAYRLLEDPDAYARWERTGSTARPQAPDVRSTIMEVFVRVLSKHKGNTKYRDVIADIRAEIEGLIAMTKQEKEQHETNAIEARGIAERFEPKDSFMAMFLIEQARQASQATEMCELKMEALRKSLIELEHHKFNKDTQAQSMNIRVFGGFGSSTTSYGSW